jgi:hypothetical protein
MKILFLTVSDQQHHPLNKYSDLHCNFDFRSWEAGLRALYHDIHILDYYASFVSNGPFGMENHIRKLVQKNNIQLLIVPNLYYELAPTFLNELRRFDCKSLVVFFDDSIRFEETNSFYLNSFDYYLTQESVASKALYKPYGISAGFFPNLPSHSFYNKIIQRSHKASVDADNDVVFVGANIADRAVFVNYLKGNNINIRVYGNGWDSGMLTTEEMLAAYNSSKICLNFIKAIDDSGRVQLKGRLFEIIMAGGFVLSEHSDEFRDYFDIGREIDTFRSPQELLDKVMFYLENSDRREEMVRKANDRVEKHYSFESNWLRYLSDIKNNVLKTSYPNPGYTVPSTAINSFLNRNLSIVYGRFMLGKYGLAYQQYEFCRRELKGLGCNGQKTGMFLKWIVRWLIITIAHRFLNQNQRFKIKQGYSRLREMVANRAFAHRIIPKLNKIRGSSIADGEALVREIAHKVYGFIEKRKVPGKDFEYFYSENSSQPTLYASTYACMTFSLLGRLNDLTKSQKLQWIEYFDGFQSNVDGLFYDPVVDSALFRSADWWGARHLALHMISAYTDLGGKPRYPFRFLEEYYDHERIKTWLDGFDWDSYIPCVDDIDNKIMNVGCLLQYQRDLWDDSRAGSAVAYLQEYLMNRVNPETGMWGNFDIQDPDQRSRAAQFAYHLFSLFHYDDIEIKYPDKVVQIVLTTQNKLGGFGVKLNSSACEDIDSIDILMRLSPLVPASRAKIDAALIKVLSWILCNQVDDGGFVFRLYEPFVYGHPETSSETNQGAMLATWFRTLSLIYLMNYLDLSNVFIITGCPGYES